MPAGIFLRGKLAFFNGAFSLDITRSNNKPQDLKYSAFPINIMYKDINAIGLDHTLVVPVPISNLFLKINNSVTSFVPASSATNCNPASIVPSHFP